MDALVLFVGGLWLIGLLVCIYAAIRLPATARVPLYFGMRLAIARDPTGKAFRSHERLFGWDLFVSKWLALGLFGVVEVVALSAMLRRDVNWTSVVAMLTVVVFEMLALAASTARTSGEPEAVREHKPGLDIRDVPPGPVVH